MTKFTTTLILTFLFSTSAFAADTFERVYSILQSNCQSCHTYGGSGQSAWDMGYSIEETYNSLVNVVPNNQAAIEAGYTLVEPGYFTPKLSI